MVYESPEEGKTHFVGWGTWEKGICPRTLPEKVCKLMLDVSNNSVLCEKQRKSGSDLNKAWTTYSFNMSYQAHVTGELTARHWEGVSEGDSILHDILSGLTILSFEAFTNFPLHCECLDIRDYIFWFVFSLSFTLKFIQILPF